MPTFSTKADDVFALETKTVILEAFSTIPAI
jgi:hypothetical protein